MEAGNQCPHCGAGQLHGWSELNQEEREVVKRLPASTDYSIADRAARHRWCTRCWFEDSGHGTRET